MSVSIQPFVDANKDRLLDELKEFLRSPSVSTQPEHKADVRKAAEFVANAMRKAKLENVEVIETKKPPARLWETGCTLPANRPSSATATTMFNRPILSMSGSLRPFEPTIRNGNLYARGSTDDKGQMYMHIKAVEALFAINGKLPVNVEFLIGGEEECGGEAIADFLPKNTAKLKADIALVSDPPNSTPKASRPSASDFVTSSTPRSKPAASARSALRRLRRRGSNPLFGLAEILTKLKDASGHINVPGISRSGHTSTAEEKHSWDSATLRRRRISQDRSGLNTTHRGARLHRDGARTWARPTLEVHSIVGGYMAPGAKTVIPAKATAKVSMRLVPDQKPDEIVAAYKSSSRTTRLAASRPKSAYSAPAEPTASIPTTRDPLRCRSLRRSARA